MDHIYRGYETLNNLEISIAKHLGKVRYQENLKKGTVDKQVGNQDPELIHIQGTAAELSYCKRANCYPDLTNYVRKGGIDCIYYEHTIDVKHNRWDEKQNQKIKTYLVVPPHKNEEDRETATYYVLMVGEKLGTYRFAGFIKADILLVPERLKDWFGHGECYAMHESELN
jgi:hypothetical protein